MSITTTTSGILIKYTEDDFKKNPEELLGQERINSYEKKHGPIVGYTKIKTYVCSQWANKCHCGFDDIEQDEDRQYCPGCGEQLFYEHEFPEKTPYKGVETAKSAEEAIKKFLCDDFDDGIEYDDVTCKEKIAIMAYFTEVPELGDGYKSNK